MEKDYQFNAGPLLLEPESSFIKAAIQSIEVALKTHYEKSKNMLIGRLCVVRYGCNELKSGEKVIILEVHKPSFNNYINKDGALNYGLTVRRPKGKFTYWCSTQYLRFDI